MGTLAGRYLKGRFQRQIFLNYLNKPLLGSCFLAPVRDSYQLTSRGEVPENFTLAA